MFKYAFPVLGLVLGGGMVVDAAHTGSENSAFRSRGEVARILALENVTAQEVSERKMKWGSKPRTYAVYRGELKFQTRAGEIVTVPTQSLPQSIINLGRTADGSTVYNLRRDAVVYYLPDRPTTVRFEERSDATTSQKLFGALIFVLGVFGFLRALRR